MLRQWHLEGVFWGPERPYAVSLTSRTPSGCNWSCTWSAWPSGLIVCIDSVVATALADLVGPLCSSTCRKLLLGRGDGLQKTPTCRARQCPEWQRWKLQLGWLLIFLHRFLVLSYDKLRKTLSFLNCILKEFLYLLRADQFKGWVEFAGLAGSIWANVTEEAFFAQFCPFFTEWKLIAALAQNSFGIKCGSTNGLGVSK